MFRDLETHDQVEASPEVKIVAEIAGKELRLGNPEVTTPDVIARRLRLCRRRPAPRRRIATLRRRIQRRALTAVEPIRGRLERQSPPSELSHLPTPATPLRTVRLRRRSSYTLTATRSAQPLQPVGHGRRRVNVRASSSSHGEAGDQGGEPPVRRANSADGERPRVGSARVAGTALGTRSSRGASRLGRRPLWERAASVPDDDEGSQNRR